MARREHSLAPRKHPQQQRSRAMVERIIAAGREVLLRDGYDAFSTNRVADQAGISPGSLYQYFPNKAAIMAAVIDRYSDDVADRVAGALTERLGDVGPAMIRATANALVDALAANVDLLRVVIEDLPAASNLDRRRALEQRVRELVMAYLAARPGTTRSTDHATTAWVLVMAIENLTVRYVLDGPAISRELFLDEVVALCTGYLAIA
ncbi:TetR/AcrR family transcriptional regulator [Nocardioides sp.]|uniref:TetR/AcrR family transcriptional regulator n=1 Tax=Nocardioides sp. TaxID=35761 RepID=UPI0031FEFF3C